MEDLDLLWRQTLQLQSSREFQGLHYHLNMGGAKTLITMGSLMEYEN